MEVAAKVAVPSRGRVSYLHQPLKILNVPLSPLWASESAKKRLGAGRVAWRQALTDTVRRAAGWPRCWPCC